MSSSNQATIDAILEHRRTRPAPAPARSNPVRVSVDLDPAQYRELVAWCASAAAETGQPRITNAAVIRALVEALADTGISARIRAALTK